MFVQLCCKSDLLNSGNFQLDGSAEGGLMAAACAILFTNRRDSCLQLVFDGHSVP